MELQALAARPGINPVTSSSPGSLLLRQISGLSNRSLCGWFPGASRISGCQYGLPDLPILYLNPSKGIVRALSVLVARPGVIASDADRRAAPPS